MKRAFFLALLAAACTADPPADGRPLLIPDLLLEQARDGTHIVPRGQVTGIDLRSDLVLRFAPELPEVAEPRDGLLPSLRRIGELGAERARSLAAFAGADAGQDAGPEMHAATAAFHQRVQEFRAVLLRSGFSDAELSAAGADPFPALARLLKQRLERTGVAALEQLLLTSLREVTVRARLEPVGKDPQWLHIDQYDDLLAGEMKSEYGRFPGASREQFARLAADLRRIDSMVAVLRSIDEQCRSGLRPLADLVEQVASACNRFCDRVETRPRDEWQLLTARLQAVVDDPAAGAARERARSALALAVQFEADWDAGVRIAAALRRALQPLAKPAPQLLGELLAADSPLRQGLLSLAPDIDRCAASTAAWPERRRQLATAVSELRTARPELGMSEAMQTFLVFVPLDLAAVAERLRRFAARFQDRDIAAAAIDLMAGQDLAAARIDPRLLQPLTNTPEARIDLGRTNVREGDRLRIEAVYRPQGDGDGKPAARENWEMEITRFGLYPKVTAELIFARADHGTVDAERWKPNAAAVAEVHNRFRDPSRWGEAWNLIDPALGVHLASLDQTDISVDFGLGFNVSVLGGFVTAGYGWNLAASADRGYYFIGIDLLNVLRNAQHFITGGG